MRRVLVVAYGVVAYALFLGVFLYSVGFVGNLLVPKGIDTGEAGPLGPAIAINLALLSIFALQHSVMARPAFKRWWTRFVPPAIERSTYVLASNAVLALLYWQWRPIPTEIWSVSAPWGRGLLWAGFALGWGLVLISSFLISHFHLFGLRQVYDHHRGRKEAPAEFQTPTLYRYLRHPLLLGFLIAFWATPDMSAGHLLFAAVSTAYIVVGATFEERDLITVFGDRYRAYQRQVPMLIPGLRRRRDGAPAAADDGSRP